jgi:hypothetical protein
MSVSFFEDVTDKSLAAGIRSIIYWNEALGCNVFLIGMKPDPDIIVTDNPRVPQIAFTDGRVGFIAKYFNKKTKCVRNAIIFVSHEYVLKHDVYRIETIFRHELGHALGLPDIPVQPYPSLMGPIIEGPYHPVDATEEDIEILRRLHCSGAE